MNLPGGAERAALGLEGMDFLFQCLGVVARGQASRMPQGVCVCARFTLRAAARLKQPQQLRHSFVPGGGRRLSRLPRVLVHCLPYLGQACRRSQDVQAVEYPFDQRTVTQGVTPVAQGVQGGCAYLFGAAQDVQDRRNGFA